MQAGDCLTLNMNAMENYLLSHSLTESKALDDKTKKIRQESILDSTILRPVLHGTAHMCEQ